MKKLIGIVAAVALLAASAFAEVGVSGWGVGVWVPFGYDGDAKMSYGAPWEKSRPRVGATVAGYSENFGFAFGFKADGGEPKINDVANVWAKPWDWLKISVGMILDDTLRVNNEFGQYKWIRAGAGNVGEDLTFRRIGGYGGYKDGGSMHGAEIALTPIDGLYIAAGFKMDKTDDFVDVLKVSQYAAGYKIEDLVAVKAQYIGSSLGYGKNEDWNLDYDNKYCGIINAAVDLLMIDGNFISIGAYIPTDFEQQITVSAVYNGWFDALSLNALVGAMINKDDKKDLTGIEIGVGVGYDLGNGLAIEGDVRTELAFPKKGDASGDISVGAFFSKGFSNGKVGVGAVVAVPFGKGNEVGFNLLGDSDKVSVAIPVRLEFNF